MAAERKRTPKSELDRLLSDEGTVKLLLTTASTMHYSTGHSAIVDSSSLKSIEELKKSVMRRANDEDKNGEGGARVSLRVNARKGSAEHEQAASKEHQPPASKRRRSSLIGSLKGTDGVADKLEATGNHKAAGSSKEVNNQLPTVLTSKIINATILHIILSFPSPTNCKLTVEMLTNFSKAIDNVNSEPNMHSVLLTSTGNSFCNGLEYETLVIEKPEPRKKKSTAMINAIRSLIQSLKNCKKNLIVGVQSDVSNFGILLLNYFDYVYISDKVNFSTDYFLYNTVPELYFSCWSKDRVIMSMFTTKRHLTAEQFNSTSVGLITEILWPSKFNEELIRRLIMISSCNSKISEKSHQLISESCNANSTLFPEQDLISIWTSDEFQARVSKIKEKRK